MKPLRELPAAQRAWAAGFLALAGLGLAVALVQVHTDSGLFLDSLRARFAGPETADFSPHTWRSLLSSTHTHLFTLAFLQLALGGFFLQSSAPSRLKAWLAGGGFAFILLDQASLWLCFWQGPAFAPLIFASGFSMTAAMATEIAWCLADLGH
jgi:hypothetical protein